MNVGSYVLQMGHAFGQTYTLPVPLWLFLFGAGSAVLASFFVLGFLVGDATEVAEAKTRFVEIRGFFETFRFVAILLFAMTIIVGFMGPQSSTLNLGVTLFWVIFLVGLTFVVAIFGNLWESINPFRTITEALEAPYDRVQGPVLAFPSWLRYWPSFIGYFGLVWLELVGRGIATTPFSLAAVLTCYTIATIAASLAFGKAAWFAYGEVFSVYFSLVARLSPFRIRDDKVTLHQPLSGLISSEEGSFGLLLFIVLMLAATGYDAIKETIVYGDVFRLLPGFLTSHVGLIGTVGLLVVLLMLLSLYVSFVVLLRFVSRSEVPVKALAVRFSFSLVPIAIAYHAAHYFTMLLITGQNLIFQASDPFASGMNIFGTANYTPTVSFLSASFVWYAEVVLIVLGHIGAVYVGHKEAMKLFGNRRKAVVSQIPLVVLMVLYTAGSLWIIAQPIAV